MSSYMGTKHYTLIKLCKIGIHLVIESGNSIVPYVIYYVSAENQGDYYQFKFHTLDLMPLTHYSKFIDCDGNTFTKSGLDDFINEINTPQTGEMTTDFLIEVAKGNVAGHSLVQKFGSASSIPTSLTVITSSKTYQTPTTLRALEVVSDDSNDSFGGTGINQIEVIGISDTNGTWTEESQIINMNGITPVSIPNNFWRIYRVKTVSSGTYATDSAASHNSTITIREVSTPANIWAQIVSEGSFGLGQSEIGAFSVQSGYTGFVLSKNITLESAKDASIFLFIRENADVVTAPYGTMRTIELDRTISERIDRTPKGILATIPEKSDVGFLGQALTGTTALSVDFEILLVENSYL